MSKQYSQIIEEFKKLNGKQIDFILSAMKHKCDDIETLRYKIATTLIKTFNASKLRNKKLGITGNDIVLIPDTILFKLATIVKSAVSWEEFYKRVIKLPKITNPWVALEKYTFDWDLKFVVPPRELITRQQKIKSIFEEPKQKTIIEEPKEKTVKGIVEVSSFSEAVIAWMKRIDGEISVINDRLIDIILEHDKLIDKIGRHTHIDGKVVIQDNWK